MSAERKGRERPIFVFGRCGVATEQEPLTPTSAEYSGRVGVNGHDSKI